MVDITVFVKQWALNFWLLHMIVWHSWKFSCSNCVYLQKSWNRRNRIPWHTIEWLLLSCRSLTTSAGFDELICGSHHVTVDELYSVLFIGKGGTGTDIEDLDCSLVCACCLPHCDRCTQRGKKSSHHWSSIHMIQDVGLPATVCYGIETWLLHFEPKSKKQLLEWHHVPFSRGRN